MKYRSRRFSGKIACGITATVAAACCAFTGVYALGASPSVAAIYKVTETREQLAEKSTALNVRIEEEGAVLLKNNGALPLASGATVDLLGVGSYNTLWGETGGGNGKTDYTYLADSLESAGFTVKKYDYSKAQQVTLAGAKVYLEPEVSTLGITGGDTAIVTISRSGKESSDNLVAGADALTNFGWETGAHQLELNKNEKALIAEASAKFDKVIVLLNSPTTMQVDDLESDDGVDAIMYIGMPGQYGLGAVGGLLSGAVNPSGKTVTMWAADFTADPTYANFGAATGAMKNDKDADVNTLEYEEGIYVGYKYYETAAAEAAKGNYDGFDYDSAVTYPFGYGMSYTSFDSEFVTTSIDLTGKSFDDTVAIQVKVTNTGERDGKDAVQIYSHAPYYENGIEKSEVTLVGFAKTPLIEGGKNASVTVTVNVRVGDIASFDYDDANADHWYGYEIEAGDYELRLQSDSHTVVDTIEYTVESSIAFDNDGALATIRESDDKTNLVFSDGGDFDSLYLASEANGGDFKAMSRASFADTLPTAPTAHDYISAVSTVYSSSFTPDMDKESDPWYVKSVPEDWTQGAGTAYVLFDMAGIDYTSTETIRGGKFDGKTGVEAWTAFMNQLTWDEIKTIPDKGSHQTVAVPSIGKPAQADSDGPEQLGDGTFWACANIIAGTWNTELAQERGELIGKEALYDGYTGWYGPTANINRSPFGGRNGIYFSEDSLLTGKMSAANVRGAQSMGVIAYLKHFAINEQETNRSGLATFLTEQALRETYLKAFEYAVKDGGALGVMQAMNRVGGVNCYGNYALDQTVLRDEWGFLGGVITDSYSSGLIRENMAQRMGGDFPLGSFPVEFAGEWDAAANAVKYNGAESPTQWSVIRNSAMHVLYMAANSNQLANGYNVAAAAAKTFDATVEVNAEIEPIDASIADFGAAVKYTAEGLPAGLTIDPATGKIAGTPTTKGESKVTVTLTVDEAGESWITASYTGKITVVGGGLTSGAIAGIVVGAVAVAAAAGVAAFIVVKKKKTAGAQPEADGSSEKSE